MDVFARLDVLDLTCGSVLGTDCTATEYWESSRRSRFDFSGELTAADRTLSYRAGGIRTISIKR
jgi:hypothetical protein